ncbi:EamA family transporter [Cohnella terricola]|uniref:EamA family transporter n=1 Tax=Cohnella terricola TaxID=1289167 RepID=A0A559J8U5_9BACL|nr:EamA family transporter [Cohnella terricola]TVX96271.1 EamA family transporter [Cohnella terricola]
MTIKLSKIHVELRAGETMDFTAIILVIVSGLFHSIWNVFTKRSVNKDVFLWFCQWAAIIIFLPFLLIEIRSITSVSASGLLLVLLSMLFHGLYVILLARAYVVGDLSQVYPIMRGTSPLLVPIIGMIVLDERLGLIGVTGVFIIVAGIFLNGDFKSFRNLKNSNKGIIYAFLVGCMITLYTILDKITLKYIPPITLNEATNLGNIIALSFFVMKSGAVCREWTVNWRTILLGGILAPGGYILFLKAIEFGSVSQLAPMREVGTVFGTLFGILILKESKGLRRIIASILITLGIIFLAQ